MDETNKCGSQQAVVDRWMARQPGRLGGPASPVRRNRPKNKLGSISHVIWRCVYIRDILKRRKERMSFEHTPTRHYHRHAVCSCPKCRMQSQRDGPTGSCEAPGRLPSHHTRAPATCPASYGSPHPSSRVLIGRSIVRSRSRPPPPTHLSLFFSRADRRPPAHTCNATFKRVVTSKDWPTPSHSQPESSLHPVFSSHSARRGGDGFQEREAGAALAVPWYRGQVSTPGEPWIK